MPKNLILHIGLHKTATTSLQDFLQANTGKLLQRGVRYIPLQRMRTDVTPLFCSADKARRGKLAEFIGSVEKETLLLSDENLIGTPGEFVQGGIYSYAANRMTTFCEDMKDYRITIFLTLREPYPFIASMYSEYLRHNEYITFERFIAGLNFPDFSYRKIFGWMQKLPSNTRVRAIPFEKEEDGGVVRITGDIIAEACGPDSGIDPSSFPSRKSRSAYSLEELELAADIARRSDPKMSQFFLNALDAKDKRFGQTRFDPLPAALVAELSARYRSDLRFFEELGKR